MDAPVIAVVTESDQFCDQLVSGLMAQGYVVLVGSIAQGMREVIWRVRPALVIFDLALGWDALQLVRRDPDLAALSFLPLAVDDLRHARGRPARHLFA